MPRTGTPRVKISGAARGLPASVTQAGPPERMTACGAEVGEEGGVDLLVGVDLAVDARLAQAAGDQLGDLAAEVDDEQALVVGLCVIAIA